MRSNNKWNPKIKNQNKKLSERFGVPYNTVRDWEKKGDYRGYLYDRLSIILQIEENSIKNIEKFFTKEELSVLALVFSKITFDIIVNKKIENIFSEYCENNEVEQFLGYGEDTHTFSTRIVKMLSFLSEFDQVVLFEYLKEEPFKTVL